MGNPSSGLHLRGSWLFLSQKSLITNSFSAGNGTFWAPIPSMLEFWLVPSYVGLIQAITVTVSSCMQQPYHVKNTHFYINSYLQLINFLLSLPGWSLNSALVNFIFFMCMCQGVHTCHGVAVGVRVQLSGVGSLLLWGLGIKFRLSGWLEKPFHLLISHLDGTF